MDKQFVLETALKYKEAGLDVIPDHLILKYPEGFNDWQTHKFSEGELEERILKRGWGIGLRNQEGLDFDNHAGEARESIRKWKELVDALCPGLVDKLLLEKTQHGGYHVNWKCDVSEGNQKLAGRLPTKEELDKNPKQKIVTFIETRGQGGQFVVSPTPGYKLLKGDWCNLPQITAEERKTLLECAKSLDLIPIKTENFNTSQGSFEGERPGDKFNSEGVNEVLELLKQEGWEVIFKREDTYYLRRPGKDKGISATYGHIAPGIFYNFSSNGAPFEPNKAYTPFAIFSLLKHNGDFSAAASELAKRYGMKTVNSESRGNQVPELENYAESWRQEKDNHPVILSGFPRLDASIGGFEAGRTYIPGGLEKCGKSTFLMNMLDNMLKTGIKVGYVDTELGHKDFFKRFAAISSRFHEKDPRNDHANIQQWVEKYVESELVSYCELKDVLAGGIPNLELTKQRFDSWIRRGAKVLVFDNITTIQNYLTGELQGWQVLSAFFNGLVKYAQEKEIVLFLILHTKSKDLLVSESYEKIKKLLEDDNPRGIFEKSVTINHKPNKSSLYGGAGMLSQITGGILFLWRPFQDFSDLGYQRVSQLILEDFRSKSPNFVNEIALDFDSSKSLYSELMEEEIEERLTREANIEVAKKAQENAERTAREDKEKKYQTDELIKIKSEAYLAGMKHGSGLKKELDRVEEMTRQVMQGQEDTIPIQQKHLVEMDTRL